MFAVKETKISFSFENRSYVHLRSKLLLLEQANVIRHLRKHRALGTLGHHHAKASEHVS